MSEPIREAPQSGEARRILVLGVGNLLLSDEGLGLRALERLPQAYNLPADVELMDGGTMGIYLLPFLDGVTDLLVLDCVQSDQPPGVPVRLEGEAIPAALAHKISVHQVGLQELLAASQIQGSPPERIVVWGMAPDSLEPGIGCSPLVEAHIDDLVHAVAHELRSWGVEVSEAVRA